MRSGSAAACEPLLQILWLKGEGTEDLSPDVGRFLQTQGERRRVIDGGCGDDLPMIGEKLAAVLHVPGCLRVFGGCDPAATIQSLASAVAFQLRLG